MSSPSSHDPDSALGRLTEELRRILADGADPHLGNLAERYGVPPHEAERCHRALVALGAAAEEPLRNPESESELPPPQLPDDYENLGEIGRGGMAVVYRARQRSLGRFVAVKVLRPDELVFGAFRTRFLQEAKVLARLRHPHIVSVHEVGEAGRNVFFSMDLIDGVPLGDLIQSGEMTPTRAVTLLRQVAGAISYSHSQGLVHRDLKPANVLVDKGGNAFVVDFGLARDLAVKGDLTNTGQLLGTPDYMSPEQARGDTERIGEATDVYALGAVLYECLTGRPPFRGKSLVETIKAVVGEEPVPARKVNPKVPRDLEVICGKAMAKEPERRYATAQAFLEDLERFAEGRPIRARPPSFGYRSFRLARRHVGPLSSSLATAVMVAALIGVLIVPMIGSNPATVLADAEALHEAGEHAGALVLMEKCIGDQGWKWEPPRRDGGYDAYMESVPGRLLAGRARCRLEQVRNLRSQGRMEDALRLVDRTLHEMEPGYDPPRTSMGPPWPGQAEILWEAAACRFTLGDAERAGIDIRAFDRVVNRDVEDRGQSLENLLALMAPAVLDPEDPLHSAAVLLLENVGGSRRYGEKARWLADLGRAAIPAIVTGCIAERTEANPAEVGLNIWHRAAYELACAGATAPLAEALAEKAGDPTIPSVSRARCSRLLSRLADLPFYLSGRTHEVELDPRALETWEQVRGLDRVEAYRRRVGLGISVFRDMDRSEPNQQYERLHQWIQTRTGVNADPSGRSDHAIVDRWWNAHGREDPREWLARALDIQGRPSPEELPRLLELLLDSESYREERLHFLLSLSAVEEMVVPAWGERFQGEPEVGMRWIEALRASPRYEDPRSEPYQLRIALLGLPDGAPEPAFLREEIRPIRVGETIRVERRDPASFAEPPDLAVVTGIEMPPGVEVRRPPPPARPGQERFRGTARLAYRDCGGGLFVELSTQLRLETEWNGVGSGGRTRAPPGFIVSAADFEWRLERHDEPVERLVSYLVLTVLEPPESSSEPWGFRTWRERIIEQLPRLADSLERGSTAEKRYREREITFAEAQGDWRRLDREGGVLANQAWISRILPLPEAVTSLNRIDGMSRSARANLEEGAFAMSRLLAGDASAVKEATRRVRRLRGRGDRRVASYWSRVYLTARAPEVREAALSRLDRLDLAPSIGAAIADQARARGLTPPAWLAALPAEVRASRMRALTPVRTVVGIAVVLAGILAAVALVPWRPGWPRLLAASLLVPAGLFVVACYYEFGKTDLLLDPVGYALAGLGAFILAREGEGPRRIVAPLSFGLAAILSGLGLEGVAPGILHQLSVIAGAIGVIGSAILAFEVLPGVRLRRRTLFRVAYTAPTLVIHLAWFLWFLGEALPRRPLRPLVGRTAWQVGMFLMSVTVLWMLVSLVVASVRRGVRERTSTGRWGAGTR